MRIRATALAVLAWLLLPAGAPAQEIRPGKNTRTLRDQQQSIYYYPPPANAPDGAAVLFLPGDGGWRGDVIDMAREVARAGYRVYGWDIKRYLEGFTGKTHLTETQMMEDIATVAEWVQEDASQRVVLAGWSQGAGMVVLAASSTAHKTLYAGVVAIGTPPQAVLGWRLADDLTYVTRKMPDEPRFPLAPYLPQLPPLRYAAINATGDEEIPLAQAKALFAAAGEPKREFVVEARGHDFGSNRPAFYAALREALRWVREP